MAADDYLSALGVDGSGTTMDSTSWDTYPVYDTARAAVVGNEALPAVADDTSRGLTGGTSDVWGTFWQNAGLAIGGAAVKQTVSAINGAGAPASNMPGVVVVPAKKDNTALVVLGIVALLLAWGK